MRVLLVRALSAWLALAACAAVPEPARSGTPPDSPVSSAGNSTPDDSIAPPIPRSACRATGTGGVPASNAELGMPAEADGIRGLITQIRAPFGQVEGFRILVEQDSTRSAGTPRADILVAATTPVVQRVGHRGTPAELRVCQEVSVWFSGPVAESFPVQARARAIVIERTLALVNER